MSTIFGQILRAHRSWLRLFAALLLLLIVVDPTPNCVGLATVVEHDVGPKVAMTGVGVDCTPPHVSQPSRPASMGILETLSHTRLSSVLLDLSFSRRAWRADASSLSIAVTTSPPLRC